jgi:hypothetical protein
MHHLTCEEIDFAIGEPCFDGDLPKGAGERSITADVVRDAVRDETSALGAIHGFREESAPERVRTTQHRHVFQKARSGCRPGSRYAVPETTPSPKAPTTGST